MRIALDVGGMLSGPSGMQVYTEQLIRALARTAPQHEFVCYAAYWDHFAQKAQALEALRAPNISFLLMRRPQRWIRLAEERFGWSCQERWLRRRSIALFHGTANLVPPLRQIPSVVTLHHVGGPSETESTEKSFYYDEMTRRSVTRAARVITISEFSRQEAIRELAVPADKIDTVWEGAGAEIFRSPGDGTAGRRLAGGPYLLFVSAINRRKNLVRLIRAFAALKRGPAIPHRLVMVGRKHESFPAVWEEVLRQSLTGDVLFLESVDGPTLASLYRGADVFVYPSLLEGFGLPLLEAMGCGTPVLAARSSCLPEIAGDAALFFDPLDEADLARELERLLDDADLRRELIEKGRRRVERFNWDETARKTLQVYQKVLDHPS